MALRVADLLSKIVDSLNFFRLHVLFFTFIPLIFSAIFYAANGETHIPYIDALFVCFSSTTVCGLVSVDLSSLTGFQQAILFFLAAIGNQVVPSWLMVYIRRRYFNKRLQYIVDAEVAKRKALAEQRRLDGKENLLRRFTTVFTTHPSRQGAIAGNTAGNESNEKSTRQLGASIRPDSITRTSAAPRRVDPNGQITEVVSESENVNADSMNPSQTSTLQNDKPNINYEYTGDGIGGVPLEKTQTVTFNESAPLRVSQETPRQGQLDAGDFGLRAESPEALSVNRSSIIEKIIHDDRTYIPPGGAPLRRRTTVWTTRIQTEPFGRAGTMRPTSVINVPSRPITKNRGYGGFPYPTRYLYHVLRKLLHHIRRRLERANLLPARTRTIVSTISHRSNVSEGVNPVKYFSDSFNALIGRNSKFYDLTEENLEELGGVEYRALNALLWIIAIYHFATQLLSFTIIAPYMNIQRWASAFSPPNLHRQVSPTWYCAFQVVSAYTTSGMSLVDQSMVPFQEAYLLLFVLTFLIFAGNLAFPIFLRFFIWSIMKLVPGTRLSETLHFLLDHPRRCYIYLFPARQTWLLLFVVILINAVMWFFFLVLGIGEPAFEAIPLGVRFAIGILQVTAVRAAGFATLSLLALAPALQVLFIIVMYLGVYPIALSVQATNVYEEKSLGVFEDEEGGEDEKEPDVQSSKPSSYGRYIAWHARRQLAFDMWWLVLVLFVLCIIERGKIQNSDNYSFFTIFSLLFDIISAYSGVGMSLGVPYANYSFSGALTPLSKLIMIVVMVRGRHRGLPVAIDRAVMLPFEFKKANSTRGTTAGSPGDGEKEAAGGVSAEVVDGDEEEQMSVINRIIDENGEVRKRKSGSR